MQLSEEIVIELSKVKIIFLLLGAAFFIAIGVWFLTLNTHEIEASRKFNNPMLFCVLGIVLILFFGLVSLFGLKKLFDKSPGLVINYEGILDNSSGVSVGVIPWLEVSGIGEYQVQKQKFISVLLYDPNKYVNKGSFLKRMANRANKKMCGTPINISTNSLKICYEELLEVIQEYYKNSQKNF